MYLLLAQKDRTEQVREVVVANDDPHVICKVGTVDQSRYRMTCVLGILGELPPSLIRVTWSRCFGQLGRTRRTSCGGWSRAFGVELVNGLVAEEVAARRELLVRLASSGMNSARTVRME